VKTAYSGYETILAEKDGQILSVWLNRPEARNAWNALMHHEWDRVLDEAADDDDVKCVVLRGKGKIFSAGHDLKEVASGYATKGIAGGWDPHRTPQLNHAWYFTKPIVAGVHGYVGPIAMAQLSNVDFVIAAEDTRFSFEQARMGGGSPGGEPLVFQFPMRVWKQLLMLGGWMDAWQARRYDFVQRVVPEDELDAEVMRWARQVCKVPLRQLQAAKSGIHRQFELMGLANMEAVQSRMSGHGSPEDMEWFQSVMDVGLKAALSSRDAEFDETISCVNSDLAESPSPMTR
jgi:2-(1,2-epoxy-1,2-dihydrophenyl)acetyl-CoA isomerase